MSTKKAAPKHMVKTFEEFIGQIKDSETYDKETLRGEISDQISRLMECDEISNAELARRLGKSRAYVTKILQGNANFTLDTLVQIARVLGCKYVPVFIPVNVWKEIEAVHLSSAQQTPDGSGRSESYNPKTDATDTFEFTA